jgi:hypothetical protein
MELTRRSFLGGTVAIATCSAIGVSVAAPFPIIRGDGVFDDTAGLNAFFAREPVVIEGQLLRHYTDDSLAMLTNGFFRVTNTIHIGKPTTILNCWFEGDSYPDGAALIAIHGNEKILWEGGGVRHKTPHNGWGLYFTHPSAHPSIEYVHA